MLLICILKDVIKLFIFEQLSKFFCFENRTGMGKGIWWQFTRKINVPIKSGRIAVESKSLENILSKHI